MSELNILNIVKLRRAEAPHDNMMRWLCDPTAGHGVSDFADRLVQRLWGTRTNESVLSVKTQYKLSDDCWPDVVVQFEQALLLIENKVNASALKAGQLGRQNELASAQQGERPLFHVLLCPDSFPSSGYEIESPSFRVLTYGVVAQELQETLPRIDDPRAQSIVQQYSEYITEKYGRPPVSGVRLASPQKIASRIGENRVWSESAFFERVSKLTPELVDVHAEFLELLTTMDLVEPTFDSQGVTSATYKVYIEGTALHPLMVYDDGRLYVEWGPLRDTLGEGGMSEFVESWGENVAVGNKTGSFVKGGVESIDPGSVARSLQKLAGRVNRPE